MQCDIVMFYSSVQIQYFMMLCSISESSVILQGVVYYFSTQCRILGCSTMFWIKCSTLGGRVPLMDVVQYFRSSIVFKCVVFQCVMQCSILGCNLVFLGVTWYFRMQCSISGVQCIIVGHSVVFYGGCTVAFYGIEQYFRVQCIHLDCNVQYFRMQFSILGCRVIFQMYCINAVNALNASSACWPTHVQ